METTHLTQKALKYDVIVTEAGRVELDGLFSPGEKVVIFVLKEEADLFTDLAEASQSSLDFWDNIYDDEDWNNA